MIRSFRPHVAIDTIMIPFDRWRHWGTARSPCPLQRGRTELNSNTGLQNLHSYPLCCGVLSCLVMSDSLQPHGLYSPPGFSVHGDSPGKNIGVGCHGDLPKPGIESRSPTLWADSLPAEPPGKPKNTGVGSLSLLQGSSQPRNRTGDSWFAGRFFTN